MEFKKSFCVIKKCNIFQQFFFKKENIAYSWIS